MMDILQFEFIQNAIAAGLLAGIACGIIGTLVVVNRIVFISGGIAHAAYGGIGMACYFGLPYVAGTLGFSLVVAAVVASVSLTNRHRSDTVIGVLWATGMAVGIIFADLTPGYNTDLMSYLFGSILTVPRQDLVWMFFLVIFILLSVSFFYNGFLAMSYDDEFARVRGIPVTFLYYLLIGMIAVSIVLIIRVVGLILVIAMLTIPPYISEKYTKSLKTMMMLSILFNCLFILVGLWVSYRFNITSGAAIIVVSVCGFLFSTFWDQLMKAVKKRRFKSHRQEEDANVLQVRL